MANPLSQVLIKTFSRGFFRLNSGLLLFLFVAIFSYCFFILTAGTITPEKALVFNLIFMISFASSPLMMLMVFLVWLIYTFKSWQYVAAQLRTDQHRFLFYSSTAMSKMKQFNSWFLMQLFISIPLLVYGAFSIVVGVIYGHYLIPIGIVLYLLLLNLLSAFIYLHILNRLNRNEEKMGWAKLAANWSKPFSFLFLYELLHRKKLAFLLTKMLSWGILTGVFLVFSDLKSDPRIAAISVLGVALAHAFLCYQNQRFEMLNLSFAKNFPYSRAQLFLQILSSYALLLIPEAIWCFLKFDFITATGLYLMMLSFILLFRTLLYRLGLQMNRYLPWIFGLFFIFFWCIMFQWIWILIPVPLLIAYLIFYYNYYR